MLDRPGVAGELTFRIYSQMNWPALSGILGKSMKNIDETISYKTPGLLGNVGLKTEPRSQAGRGGKGGSFMMVSTGLACSSREERHCSFELSC